MARIEEFTEVSKGRTRLHDTVGASFATFLVGPERMLQIDTYGREDRKFVGSISQSIQLDRSAALKLKAIIEKTFPS